MAAKEEKSLDGTREIQTKDEEVKICGDGYKMADKKRPHLLTLPLEVLHLIQRHMDQATFFISLLTCKYILNAASSRPLVLYHLRKIPGLSLGVDDLETNQLLFEFRRRLAASGLAAGVLANVQDFAGTPGSLMSRSAFTPHEPTSPRCIQTTLAVTHRSGIIQLYELSTHHVRRREELHVRPEDGNHNRMDVLKMAFASGSRDLAALCRQEDDSGCPPRFADPNLHKKVTIYKLVVFHRLFAKHKGYYYSSIQQDTRDVAVGKGAVPVGLALASNGTACVAWNHPDVHLTSMVNLVYRHHELLQSCSYDPSPPVSKLEDPPGVFVYGEREGLVFSMQFAQKGKRLHLFEAGCHIHSWHANVKESNDRSRGYSNTHSIDVNKDGISVPFTIGTPFYASHYGGVVVDPNSVVHCGRSYLALGITNSTYGSDHPSIFILQQDVITLSQQCDHLIDLDAGSPLANPWIPVALLSGYRQGETSLGTVMAVSPDGTRIAAAIWSRVYLWSLEPRSLLQGSLHLYFPSHDYNVRKGIGRLRPSILPPSKGVIHRMMWVDEERLFAVTDRGLVRWDMGNMRSGEKEDLSWDLDSWPETAISLPTPKVEEVQNPADTITEDTNRRQRHRNSIWSDRT